MVCILTGVTTLLNISVLQAPRCGDVCTEVCTEECIDVWKDVLVLEGEFNVGDGVCCRYGTLTDKNLQRMKPPSCLVLSY